MARVLVTGASGLLGANLALTASGHEVIAASHAHPVGAGEIRGLQADLSVPGVAREVVDEIRPDWVVHCAAATDVDACEADPQTAQRLNVEMARRVAEAARAAGARLVHVSTDAVFDGLRGAYVEEDPARPVNVYARSKRAGEVAVAEACPEALIVRTNIYGWNAQPKDSLAEWFIRRLEARQECHGFADVFVSPILATDLAAMLLRMLQAGLSGLYHVAGAECVSKHAFGIHVAGAFGLDAGLIRPASVDEAGLRAPRPKKLCLRCDRASRALGMRMPGLEEGLTRFRMQRSDGHRDRLHAMLRGTSPLP
jgi:dTDP-4-dehydrorhamnose reductase